MSDRSFQRRLYAVIGLGVRCPLGTNSPQDFFEKLRDEVDCIEDIPSTRWHRSLYYSPRHTHPGKMTTQRGGFISPLFAFDSDCFSPFLSSSRRIALSIDISIKVFLEVVLDALGDSNVKYRNTRTGVFLSSDFSPFGCRTGTGTGTATDDELFLSEMSGVCLGGGGVAGFVANVFGLKGPCGTYLSSEGALREALNSLEKGESEMAIVGGINLLLDPGKSIALSQGGLLSDACRCFDAAANGYVRSEACVVLVLCPLEKTSGFTRAAESDSGSGSGSRVVYGLIRGMASNHDDTFASTSIRSTTNSSSSQKAAFNLAKFKPSGQSIEEVMRSAFRNAGCGADSGSPGGGSQCLYVEASCVGSAVGDPTEVRAIGRVCGRKKTRKRGRRGGGTMKNVSPPVAPPPLRIGSVKSSFGNCEGVGLLVSIVKVCLMIDSRMLLPTRGIRRVNPKLNLRRFGIRIQTHAETFDPHGALFAVNSFGIMGDNCCVVIQGICAEPVTVPRSVSSSEPKFLVDGPFPFVISARSKEAVRSRLEQLTRFSADRIEPQSQCALAHTLNTMVRTDDRFLLYGIGSSLHEAVFVPRPVAVPQTRFPLIFVFSGHAPVNLEVGRILYDHYPVFRSIVDRSNAEYLEQTGIDLIHQVGLFGSKSLEDEDLVKKTIVALPSLVFTQLGLFELLRSFGVHPSVVVGHSFGNVCSLYATGALSFEEVIRACAILAKSCEVAEDLGIMIAVGASVEQIRTIIEENGLSEVYLASENSPVSCTVAGVAESIYALDRICEEKKLFHRILSVPGPYHTPLLAGIREEAKSSFADLNFRSRTTRFMSTVSGDFMEEVFGPDFLVDSVVGTVRFRDSIECILREYGDKAVFVEVSGHPVLALSMKQCEVKNTIPTLVRRENELKTVFRACCRLVSFGYEIDWPSVSRRAERLRLPSYPFQRRDCFLWMDGPGPEILGSDLPSPVGPLVGQRLDSTGEIYRTRVNTHMFPWLEHNVVKGEVVFPIAAFIEAGIQAIEQVSSEVVNSVTVWDVAFHAPMPVPTDRLVFRMLETSVSESHLTISSRRQHEVGLWTKHMDCRIGRVSKTEGLEKVPVCSDWAIDDGQAMSQCEIYQRFELMLQLRFGQSFRCIESCVQGDEEVVAVLSLESLQNIEFVDTRYHVHPAILGCVFQTLLLTDRETRGYVSTSIGCVRVHRRISPTRHPKLLVRAWLTNRNSRIMVGSLVVVDHDTKQVLLDVSGFRFSCSVDLRSPQDIASDAGMHLQTSWQPLEFPRRVFEPMLPDEFLAEEWKEMESAIFPTLRPSILAGIASSLVELRGLAIPSEKHSFLNWISKQQRKTEGAPLDLDEVSFDASHFDPEHELISNLVNFFAALVRKKGDAMTEGKRRNLLMRSLGSGDTLSFRSCKEALHAFFIGFTSQIMEMDRVVRVLELSANSCLSFAPMFLPCLGDMSGRAEVILSHRIETSLDFVRFIRGGLNPFLPLTSQSILFRSIDVCVVSPSIARHSSASELLQSILEVMIPNGLLLWLDIDESARFWLDFVFGTVVDGFCPSEDSVDELFLEHGFEYTSIRRGAVRIVAAWIPSSDDDSEPLQFQRLKVDEQEEGGEQEVGAVAIVDHPDPIALLKEVHRRISANDFSPLLVVTRGLYADVPKLDYAPLIGLVRVLSNEFPDWILKTIDLSNVSDEVEYSYALERCRGLFPSLERECKMHHGQVSVPRLVRMENRVASGSVVGVATTKYYRLFLNQPAQIDSLAFHEMEKPFVGRDQVFVRVLAASLNIKDLMLSTNPAKRIRGLGMEFAGVVVAVGSDVVDFAPEDAVMGFSKHSLSSHVLTSTNLLVKKPPSLSFNEAATIPFAYTSAYFALVTQARVKQGDRVLIHSAAECVGQAAVEIVASCGAQSLVTARTPREREFLKSRFELLGVAELGSDSWESDFGSLLKSDEFDDPRVDIVVNCLPRGSVDLVERSLRMLKPFGALARIGLGLDSRNYPVVLDSFAENLSLYSIHVDRMIEQSPTLVKSILVEVTRLFDSVSLRPIHIEQVFRASEVVDAFSSMKEDRIGKIVVSFEEDAQIEVLPSLELFSSSKTYVLSGGLGVIGFELMKWMVLNGARNIVLLSRSGKTKKSQDRYLSARNRRATVVVSKTDVTDEEQVRHLFETVLAGEEIGGLFHLASVVHDGPVGEQSEEMFRETLAPKILGITNLLKFCHPEVVLLFSSVASTIGNPSQSSFAAADSHLNLLASHLYRVRGIRAKVLNIGAVVDVGAYSESLERRKTLERGMLKESETTIGEVLDLVRVVLESPDDQIEFIPDIDFLRVCLQCPHLSLRLGHLCKWETPPTGSGASVDPDVIVLRQLVGSLVLMDPDSVPLNEPLTRYGVDSLLAAEICSVLERQYHLSVSQMEILRGITIDEIVNRASLDSPTEL